MSGVPNLNDVSGVPTISHAAQATTTSLSLSAEDATLRWDAESPMYAAVPKGPAMALPRILHPSTLSTVTPALRWPPRLLRDEEMRPPAVEPCNALTSPVQGTQLSPPSTTVAAHQNPNADPQRHLSPDAKRCRDSPDVQDSCSVFTSRTRGGEMSSFGISVSTATAAAGWSASTMPTRWLRSTDIRALGCGLDSTPSNSPLKNPNVVFERWVQTDVTRTEDEEKALLFAANELARSMA